MDSLVDYCSGLAQSAAEAEAWAKRNADIVRNEQEGLCKELRRAGRLFRHCARAAGRKMCAGVFGPSQAGKSYLISALARDASGALMASFGGEEHDFLLKINPEGGKESTGLVTRFTMTKPASLPEGHPVQARLLTEMDLVKILANTYFADCELKDDPQSNILDSLDAIEKLPNAASPIDLDNMEDLREYLVKNFRAKARVQDLERLYWARALALAPRLAMEGRLRLYSLIWDEVEPFTNLLRTLLSALEMLGHPDEAFCTLDALIPREGSIIDVATLNTLNDPNASLIGIVTAEGRSASLPRGVVTALTAELTISMARQPAPYFDHTDLLDFPGYRSRYKFDDVRKELQKPGMLKEMFLRGKVAYLFQRYCADRELTSMLLCIGPSNQEVQDLPGVINDWVSSTHGEHPEDRAGKPVSLFFVLTKFDMEFEQKKGAPSVEFRWDNRLGASLLNFFGTQHDWPTRWDGVHAFNNLYLLRNPNFRFDAILEYDSEGREKGIRPEMQAYVNALEASFLNSNLVAAHFSNPREAWDAAMKLNDGGIARIRDALSPLCDPSLKESQIRRAVEELCSRLSARLAVFYQTDDKEEERNQKMLFIRRIYGELGQLEKQYRRLGLLLRSLTIRDADIFDMHDEARQLFRARADTPPELEPAGDSAEPPIDPLLFNPDEFNPFTPKAAPSGAEEASASAENPGYEDESGFFANYVESRWISCLRSLAEDTSAQQYFMLPERDFTALVSELSTGARRLGIGQQIAKACREAARYADTRRDSIEWQQAGMAASIINGFVDWLGLNPRVLPEKERTFPGAGGKSVVLFTPPVPVEGFPKISEQRAPYTETWYADWLKALYELVMGNLLYDGQKNINIEENSALKALIRRFSVS